MKSIDQYEVRLVVEKFLGSITDRTCLALRKEVEYIARHCKVLAKVVKYWSEVVIVIIVIIIVYRIPYPRLFF